MSTVHYKRTHTCIKPKHYRLPGLYVDSPLQENTHTCIKPKHYRLPGLYVDSLLQENTYTHQASRDRLLGLYAEHTTLIVFCKRTHTHIKPKHYRLSGLYVNSPLQENTHTSSQSTTDCLGCMLTVHYKRTHTHASSQSTTDYQGCMLTVYCKRTHTHIKPVETDY